MRRVIIGGLTVVLAAAVGCVVGETTHRLYLDPDGGVSWMVFERDLRSNAATPAERTDEEASFLVDYQAGAHPVVRAFELLAPVELGSRMVRERRPYAVLSEARFDSVARLAEEILYLLGVDGTVSLSSADGLTTLEIEVVPGEEEAEPRDDAVLALAADLEAYRIILTEGHFVDAVGFAIEDEGSAAVPLEPPETAAGEPLEPICLRLVWQLDPAS